MRFLVALLKYGRHMKWGKCGFAGNQKKGEEHFAL